MGRVVLVTGIASTFASQFALRVADLKGVDKVVGIDTILPGGQLDGVKFVRADIRTPVVGKVLAVEDVDTVVHLGVGPPTRGRSSAACGSRPSSITAETNCTWACAWMKPPMIPNGPSSPPSLSSIPGISVWYGRRPAATSPATAKPAPRLLSVRPVPGTMMPEPKWANRLWISDTAMPSSSTTHA